MSALVYSPFPDRKSAEDVSGRLLDEGLVACVNIGAPVHSLFVWNGERASSEEVPVLLKTHDRLLDRAMARLETLHPYDTPAITGWTCRAGAATQAWLGELVERDEHAGQ